MLLQHFHSRQILEYHVESARQNAILRKCKHFPVDSQLSQEHARVASSSSMRCTCTTGPPVRLAHRQLKACEPTAKPSCNQAMAIVWSKSLSFLLAAMLVLFSISPVLLNKDVLMSTNHRQKSDRASCDTALARSRSCWLSIGKLWHLTRNKQRTVQFMWIFDSHEKCESM